MPYGTVYPEEIDQEYGIPANQEPIMPPPPLKGVWSDTGTNFTGAPGIRKLKSPTGEETLTNVPEQYGITPPKPKLEDDMPKLYSPQQNAPPGPRPPDPATMARTRFAEGFIKNELGGFNPLNFDPVNEAYNAVLEQYDARYGRGAALNSNLKNNFLSDVDTYTKRLISKKQTAENYMKSAFDKFDKDLELSNVPEGNVAIRKGSGEQVFANPRVREAKTPNEIELTQRALKGDKEAQATLDAMQKRKEDAARAGKALQAEGIDIPSLAQSIADGQDAPMAIKGSMGNPVASKVKTEVLKKYPKFDMGMADANYKWKQSSTNQRTINFAGGALPRLGALDDQLSKLPNADINVINKMMGAVSKQFGKPEYTNFESNRNAIVQEINTALSGTSQASDMRVKIELENLTSARSPQQIRGAISNLREALIARLDVDLSPLYPIEVVRGEKTMKQYKDEMFKRYRGNYTTQEGSAAPPAGDRVKVKSPDGKVGTIPNGQLDAALKQGYVRAE